MADLEVQRGDGEELERRLRLKTFPLALKLLEKEEDITNLTSLFIKIRL